MPLITIPKNFEEMTNANIARKEYWAIVGIFFGISVAIGAYAHMLEADINTASMILSVFVGMPVNAYLVNGRLNNVGQDNIWLKVIVWVLSTIPFITFITLIVLGVIPPKKESTASPKEVMA